MESGEDRSGWQERLKRDGIWLFDAPLELVNPFMEPTGGELIVLDLLPESDDWEDEWVIVETLLPDGRLVAMGLPEPFYSDFLDAVLWMSVIAAFAGAACYYLSKFLTSRLSDISAAARRLALGDIKSRIDVAPAGGDELSDLARLFNKMAGSVEQVIENERRLLYDISHELRSPLARMHLSLDLLRRQGREQSEEYMDLLASDIDRMTLMMNAIMEQGRTSFVPGDLMEPFDLCELLEDTVKLANFEVRNSRRNVYCRITEKPDEPVLLDGNRSLMEQAVQNILSNALRYSPEGEVVDVSAELISAGGGQSGGRFRLTVRDYGPGVSEESLPKLFRPFFRVDEARDQDSGGVGLGLALAHEYVRRHHGGIVAENRQPGLAIIISLPLKRSA